VDVNSKNDYNLNISQVNETGMHKVILDVTVQAVAVPGNRIWRMPKPEDGKRRCANV